MIELAKLRKMFMPSVDTRGQKGGAQMVTCAERDKGAVGSVDAMEAGAVGICMLVV